MDALKILDAVKVEENSWKRPGAILLIAALVAGVLAMIGFFRDPKEFSFAFLVPFVFFLTIALGCLFFVLIQHLTRAGWSVVVRRIAEAAAMTVLIFLPLFVFVILGRHELFHWTHADAVAHDHLLQHKSPYLNFPFFVVRAIVYFLVWGLLATYFYRASIKQDETGDPGTTVAMQRRSAPSIILFGLALTFMAFDWLMSLDPHWFSTIFGVYIFAGSTLAAMSFILLVSLVLRNRGILANTILDSHLKDLGRFMFAFAVFWAYIGFSQFFLIWYGNIPEETLFFIHRLEGGWKPFSLFLVLGHFIIPFILLMGRSAKNSPQLMGGMAVWILFMHYLDLFWVVIPNHRHHIGFSWMDLACLVLVGGLFVAWFARIFTGKNLIPVGDPRLAESLRLDNDY